MPAEVRRRLHLVPGDKVLFLERPNGEVVVAKAGLAALMLQEHRLVLTDWIIGELQEVVRRKRPDLLAELDALLAGIDHELAGPGDPSILISDSDDQPILDAALAAAVDVIVTGDSISLPSASTSPGSSRPATSPTPTPRKLASRLEAMAIAAGPRFWCQSTIAIN